MPHSRNDSLDGLRLLAVAAVLAFHFRLPHAGAGFLGVDLFFVLSGFLITSLLLGQVRQGRVGVADFWTRRARRLVPALIPVVVAVLVWGAVVAPSVSRDRLRGDIGSTLLYFANWHFINASTYFANDGVVSPLEHMWSLGVEEQFYLVWPLLLAVVAILLRSPRQRLVAVGLLAGAGVAVSVWRLGSMWGGDPNRAYLGTDSRIFEPLAGALLAVLITSPRARSAIGRAHWPLVLLGAAGLAWALATLGGPGGATSAYAHGGAAIVAASATAVIAAFACATSGATRMLALRPVAYLGRLSYGIYLWHWPLIVWTGYRGWWDLTGLGTPLRAFLLTVATVALAAASYHLVESPIRYGTIGRFLVPRRTFVVLAGVLTALFFVNQNVVVPHAGAALGRTTKTIVLVGDSVPQRLAPELSSAAARHGYVVISATRGSCPATGVALVNALGKPWGPGPKCATDVPRPSGRRGGRVPSGPGHLVEPLRARRPRRRPRPAGHLRQRRLLGSPATGVRSEDGRAHPGWRHGGRRRDRTHRDRDRLAVHPIRLPSVPLTTRLCHGCAGHLELVPGLAQVRLRAGDQHPDARLPRRGQPLQRPPAERGDRTTRRHPLQPRGCTGRGRRRDQPRPGRGQPQRRLIRSSGQLPLQALRIALHRRWATGGWCR